MSISHWFRLTQAVVSAGPVRHKHAGASEIVHLTNFGICGGNDTQERRPTTRAILLQVIERHGGHARFRVVARAQPADYMYSAHLDYLRYRLRSQESGWKRRPLLHGCG